MLDQISKSFKSKNLFYAMEIIAFISSLSLFVRNIYFMKNGMPDWENIGYYNILAELFVIIVLFANAKKDVGIIKAAIGMLLGVILFQNSNYFIGFFLDTSTIDVYLNYGLLGCILLLINIIEYFFCILFCVNHLIISSGCKSSKKCIKYNAILYMCEIVICILEIISMRLDNNIGETISYSIFCLAMLSILYIVVFVENDLEFSLDEKELSKGNNKNIFSQLLRNKNLINFLLSIMCVGTIYIYILVILY